MEINVTVSCPDLVHAAQLLSSAFNGVGGGPAGGTAKPASTKVFTADFADAPVPHGMGVTPEVQPVANPTPATAMPAPVQAPTAPSAIAVPTAAIPQITGDMVAKAGADLIAANRAVMPALNALLQKYGVSCAQELRPDQVGAFATEMRALGAKI